MVYLKEVVKSNDIDSLIFTSDNSWNGFRGTPPETFLTINFQTEPAENLETLREIQPDKPLMVMEFWTGWYDYWFGEHNIISSQRNDDDFQKSGRTIFFYYFVVVFKSSVFGMKPFYDTMHQ